MAVSDEIRKWIAENLLIGCSNEQLEPLLLSLGLSAQEAQEELQTASYYIEIAREANKQTASLLQRREALLKTLDYLKRGQDYYVSTKRVKLPPFQEFLHTHYYENRMGIFNGGIEHWDAMKWTPRGLVDKVGADTMVEIQKGRTSTKDYEIQGDKYKYNTKFGAFIDMVENTENTNDFYMTANNLSFNNPKLRALLDDLGDLGQGYLNPAQNENHTFLWIGPRGIVTPLHHDRTNNLFVQIYGRKRFRMIPSLQVPYMYNRFHVYSELDLLNSSPDDFPDFANVTMIDFEVGPGDIVFIPIGWWHHVVGESASISVSFTNFHVNDNEMIDYPEG